MTEGVHYTLGGGVELIITTQVLLRTMLPIPSVRPTPLDGTYLRPKLLHKALRQLMGGADLRTGAEVVEGLHERSKCHTVVESDGRSTGASRGSTRALNAFSTFENAEPADGQTRGSRLGPEERRRIFERLCEPRRDYER
ncbi:hypothetical protein FOZ61_006718, partial [Perkinsus olseni]